MRIPSNQPPLVRFEASRHAFLKRLGLPLATASLLAMTQVGCGKKNTELEKQLARTKEAEAKLAFATTIHKVERVPGESLIHLQVGDTIRAVETSGERPVSAYSDVHIAVTSDQQVCYYPYGFKWSFRDNLTPDQIKTVLEKLKVGRHFRISTTRQEENTKWNTESMTGALSRGVKEAIGETLKNMTAREIGGRETRQSASEISLPPPDADLNPAFAKRVEKQLKHFVPPEINIHNLKIATYLLKR